MAFQIFGEGSPVPQQLVLDDCGTAISLDGQSFSLSAECDIANGNPVSKGRVVDIWLDRDSFTTRGFSDNDLGWWSNDGKKGLFYSMFLALQNMNFHAGHPWGRLPYHPWNKEVDPWDRGLGAHVDWEMGTQGKGFYELHVYDRLNIPTSLAKVATVVGRFSHEEPFSKKKDSVVANSQWNDFAHNGVIYLRIDNKLAPWVFGLGMDEDVNVRVNDLYYLNVAYFLAHEAGHLLGFRHICDSKSIMHSGLGHPVQRPKWQTPARSSQLIADFVKTHF